MRVSVVGGEKIEVGRICKCCDFSIACIQVLIWTRSIFGFCHKVF